ncbi:hypothetical protein H4R99_000486 [Coemansia sp. RSA 1722]|nr:hypothetical protein LPJ57_000055 [Coemansia sp. RSA 486]KAJ2234877.1 hypothetical protein IWW45_003066 [Coemansia sp. RSA 485]KAJ2606278.1 hypothetical protein H4R99_000486 [Coemansia sp. RSA 1722]
MSATPPPSAPLPALQLSENVALDRQQAAITASRTMIRSPSRTMRSAHMQETNADHEEDEGIMLSVAGLSLSPEAAAAASTTAIDDESGLSAAAQKTTPRLTKRTSRAPSDFAQRPHTNTGHPPMPQHPSYHRSGSNTTNDGTSEPPVIVEPRAPTPAMYWSQKKTWGTKPPKMRSQTINAIGSHLYVFGGWNNSVCYNDVYVLDTEAMFWSRMKTSGDQVPPCRAHTSTAVGHRLFVFGGGDGTQYFSDLYVLDTRSCVWTRARVAGASPSSRRTHTCFHYNGYVYLFGGGDGHRALNDLWRVRAEPNAAGAYEWEEVETSGGRPFPRGYHTSTLVGNQVVVFGGSDGQECFGDTSLLNLDTMEWTHVSIDPPLTRLAHTATLVGMYLFVICGHDGSDYSHQVLMLKLDTLRWETRTIYGSAPAPRGYHACVLHDGRLFLHGGYNGQEVFDDLHTLDLSSYSYLPQVPEFVIGCHR